MNNETTTQRAKRRKKIHVTNIKVRDTFKSMKSKPKRQKSKWGKGISSTKVGAGDNVHKSNIVNRRTISKS